MNSHAMNCRQLGVQPFGSKRLQPCLRLSPAAVPATISIPKHAQRDHHIHQQPQALCPLRRQREQQRVLVCSKASSSSGDTSSPKPPAGSVWSWFDRLPPKVQLGIMGGLLFIGMFVIPFLQPTFLYGNTDSSKAAPQSQITNVKESTPSSSEPQLYKLPRYVPVASELYDFLQENSMPKKMPDGRTESPGVLRIYLSSMIILGLFYACSGLVGLIVRSVVAVLRAVKVVGPPKPEQ